MPKINSVHDLIMFFDVYRSSFQVTFQHKSSFHTNFGGFISLIIFILGISVLVCLYVFLVQKDEQKIVTFNLSYKIPPPFYLNSDYENITYSETEVEDGFFFIAVYFHNIKKKKAYTIEEINRFLNLELGERIFFKQVDKYFNPLLYDKCNLIHPNISSLFNNTNLDQGYCFKNKSLLVEGDFINEWYKLIQIRLSLRTITDQSAFLRFLDNLKVIIYRSDYTMNYTLTDASPIKYILKSMEVNLIDNNHFEGELYLSFNHFYSNDDIYTPWKKKIRQNCIKLGKLIQRIKPITENSLMTLYVRSAYKYEKYNRSYKGFFDLLCQIGGVWKVFLFIGAIIVVPVSQNLMSVAISNKVFSMINPDNECEVQLTYEEFLKREEEYGKTPKIFESLNPVLKQISMEYYRYERNKGMKFTVKEALSKIFCRCFSIKSMQKKELIFRESHREIEKRLDTINIAKFALKLKAIKQYLMGNKLSLLNTIKRNDLQFNSLPKLRNQLNKDYFKLSANPINQVYFKQTHLVNAFTILRNQGDLSKTDIVLIHLFDIKPELIMKFFIMYSDRFQHLYPQLCENSSKKSEIINDSQDKKSHEISNTSDYLEDDDDNDGYEENKNGTQVNLKKEEDISRTSK